MRLQISFIRVRIPTYPLNRYFNVFYLLTKQILDNSIILKLNHDTMFFPMTDIASLDDRCYYK